MNCPYCNKLINGMTGLQEVQKFQKHLRTCRKHPDRVQIITERGKLKTVNPATSLLDALEIRANSNQ